MVVVVMAALNSRRNVTTFVPALQMAGCRT
jgi:hypothetical protein